VVSRFRRPPPDIGPYRRPRRIEREDDSVHRTERSVDQTTPTREVEPHALRPPERPCCGAPDVTLRARIFHPV